MIVNLQFRLYEWGSVAIHTVQLERVKLNRLKLWDRYLGARSSFSTVTRYENIITQNDVLISSILLTAISIEEIFSSSL